MDRAAVAGLVTVAALLATGLALWLFWQRAEFHARSDPPSIRQGVMVLITALLFTLAYGVAGFYLLDRHYQVNFGFVAALRQTLVMFTQFYDPGLQPITGFGRYFADSIYIISAITFGYAGVMLLRPVLVHEPASLEERLRAKAIVEAYGRSALARFTLFPDKAYHFGPGEMKVLGAHMLEVCSSIADGKPSMEIHPLSIGGKADPVRLVFNVKNGPALNASLIDLGNRFRMIVNLVDVVAPDEPLPNLPVARVVWVPRPNLPTAAAAWIHAGGAHHTGFSQVLTSEHLEDFSDMAGIEFVKIDQDTNLPEFKKELRWNEVYYFLAKGF